VTASFTIATPEHIRFGVGAADEAPGLLARLVARTAASGPVLVVTGGSPRRHAGLIDAVPDRHVEQIRQEPTVDDVRRVLVTAREHQAHAVLAVGGGSVLDAGKAVACLLANGGDSLDYLEVVGRGQPITERSVPLVTVPTTAGSGSEVTANAVLAVPEHGVKASLRSPLMLAHAAVVDPRLMVGCPPAVTAASGMDALTQCLEPFVSRFANPVVDAWAREGLRRAGRWLRAAYDDGADLDAREGMALASLCGGLSLANAKLGAIHGFAGPLGGMVDASHGALCAALAVPVVEVNVVALQTRAPDAPALARYTEAMTLLTGHPDTTLEHGLAWLRDLVAHLRIPGLAALGLAPEEADVLVANAARASSMRGNPIDLTEAELHAVVAAAMH